MTRWYLVRFEALDAAGLEDVVLVSQSQLTPFVGAEGEEPARVSDDGCVFIAAAQLHNQVLFDPEFGRRVFGELGLAEGEDGARFGDLWLIHYALLRFVAYYFAANGRR